MGGSSDYYLDSASDSYDTVGGTVVMAEEEEMPSYDGGYGYGYGYGGGGHGGGWGGKKWGHRGRGGGGGCGCRKCHRKFNFLMMVIITLLLFIIGMLALMGKKLKYF